MNKRRLLKLAKLLRADAKNKKGIKFDLSVWGIVPLGEPVKLDCNTTACAVGLAVLSGAFKREGLGCTITANIPMPTYRGECGFRAVEEFFGIPEWLALHLFHKEEYPPAKRQGAVGERAVATRIEGLCSRKTAP